MKQLFFCTGMCLSSLSYSQARKALADPIKVTKNTPVFLKPSKSAKVIADLEAGTLLTLREISPRSSWILVEDVDGNKGWVPSDRTDYSMVGAPNPTPSPLQTPNHPLGQDTPPPAIATPPVENENAYERGRASHLMQGASRYSDLDRGGSLSWGFLYTFAFPEKAESKPELIQQSALQFGVLSTWKRSSTYQIPLRYRSLEQKAAVGYQWIYGPDLGALYSAGGHWQLSLGYSFTWGHLAKSSWLFSFRPGIEFSPLRPSLELSVGRSF